MIRRRTKGDREFARRWRAFVKDVVVYDDDFAAGARDLAAAGTPSATAAQIFVMGKLIQAVARRVFELEASASAHAEEHVHQ